MASKSMGHGVVHASEKAKDSKGTFKRLLNYLNPMRTKLILVFILSILSVFFMVISPKILGSATNLITDGVMLKGEGIGGIDFTALFKILVILAVCYIVSSLFSYIQQYLMADVAQKTVFILRQDVDQKLARLPLKFFDSHLYGDVLSTITNDVDTISNTLQQSITQLITSVVTVVGVAVMMFTISTTLTIIVLLTLPVGVLVIRPIVARSQSYFSRQQNLLGDLNGHIEEMYTGHRVVKAFNYEDDSIKVFTKVNTDLYDSGWRAQFISSLVMPLMMFVNNLGYIIIAVVGGFLAVRGSLSIGDIQAFIQYSRQFTQPINQLANIANIFQATLASAERVFNILDEEEIIPDAATPAVLDHAEGSVTFEHVKFGYDPAHILMKDIDIKVKPGQMVAVVGPTGAGKTTLINLLMRFYELNGGAIKIDGVNITDLTRVRLRELFGMVLQDTWLFKGSIKDNIAYGRDDATFEEVVAAAKAAHADHFIGLLPDGYDTILNEEASNISQGQKQLLTIARAILANPTILILDEATSSVDTRTESAIQKAMANLMKGRTSFVIAHRLSTIKDADLILVMKGGNVIEQGTHDELLAKGGLYADLYNSQFAHKVS